MRSNDEKKPVSDEDNMKTEKTYESEGMAYGAVFGLIAGALIGYATRQAGFLLLGASMGPCIGLAIGSEIKKPQDQEKN